MLSSLYFCSELLCTPWNSYINHFFYQLIFIFLQPHTLESLHIFTDIFQKKKKIIPTISTDFALILIPSNHLHQIKYLIQSLYPFLFGSCLTILSMQERWKKKKICWVSNIVSSLFSRFAEWYIVQLVLSEWFAITLRFSSPKYVFILQ